MKINLEDFLVKPDKKILLKEIPTMIDPFYTTKKDYKHDLDETVEKLDSLQNLHYASGRYALLLIFQGMDTAGKDGAIRHVTTGINPQSFQIFSFKQPSEEELKHDFLWRTTKRLPERGKIGIFNRSYYEEVLVVKVHPEILNGQNLPDDNLNLKSIWKERYTSIVDFEEHMYRSGTRIMKFFLNVSKEEQKNRFLERIDDPAKNWKFSINDVKERGHWDDYMEAFQSCLNETSTAHAPWYIIPADDKKNARLIVSRIFLETFRKLEMNYPVTTEEHRQELKSIRGKL